MIIGSLNIRGGGNSAKRKRINHIIDKGNANVFLFKNLNSFMFLLVPPVVSGEIKLWIFHLCLLLVPRGVKFLYGTPILSMLFVVLVERVILVSKQYERRKFIIF